MDSEIRLDELVENKDRKFGANNYYYPCKIVFDNGDEFNALFTKDQIEVAIERAYRNPEDMPEKSFWELLFG